MPVQVAPVRFILRAQLTTSDLHLLGADGLPLTKLDFGAVPLSARR